MSRKVRKFKSHLLADQIYNSIVVAKFTNHLMHDGKKSIASDIIYSVIDSLEPIAKEKKTSKVDLFLNAIESLKPSVKMKSRRIGGATYQVPRPLRASESEMIAIKWLIEVARSTKGLSMKQSLFNVFRDTIEGRGNAIKKKDEMHRTAEANKAFAHFA
jgi:small subunit ribosomal protein S7